MRKRFFFPIFALVLALATATALWAQGAPTTTGKAMQQCAMHATSAPGECCQHGKVCCDATCCTDGQCAAGTCSCCGQEMACGKDQQCCAKDAGQCATGQCCKDGQCQDCAQGCCTQTETGMQCTMPECKTHCK
ncbi:MAG: hypothetical protein ACYDBB_19350 [Armatimonadota bacterium]